MAKLNFLVFLQSYQDSNSSNNPSLNSFKWTRDANVLADNPESQSISLAPGESKTLFSGSRSLAQDNTTEYSIAKKASSSNTYILSATAGTLPNFRTPRSIGSDATTEVTVTKNGPVMTFQSTAGTSFNFGSSQVGDYVRIGDLFNQLNRGAFKIIAKTADSVSVENEVGAEEGPITLGVDFDEQFQVYSAAGVQVGDTLVISDDFSEVTQGSYKITDVSANSLEFYFTDVLPEESDILTNVSIYSAAKRLVYLESNQKVNVTVNGTNVMPVEPMSSSVPGIFMLNSTAFSLEVENISTESASLFIASVE